MIRVLIAEDQTLLRGAIAALLSLEKDIEVVGQASDGLEALELAKKHSPDVLLTDIEMPGISGIELAKTLQKSSSSIRVLIVTTFARPGYLERARAAGVQGYMLKDAPSETLAMSIRKVSKGQVVIEKGLMDSVWTIQDPLNERERKILSLAEQGKTNKAIANELSLAVGTVRNYLADITQKVGAKNRIEAFRIARENGWL